MNLQQALDKQDSQCFDPMSYEWTEADKAKAREKLYDSIYSGAPWDENLKGYRVDMLIEIERVLVDALSDKVGRMRDIRAKYITMYCRDEVDNDPDRYCEVSEDLLDEAA